MTGKIIYEKLIYLPLVISILLISSCGEKERTNVLKADGSPSFAVMDFSEPLPLSPVPDGWWHRTFWLSSAMDISFVTKENIPSICLSTDNSASMLIRYVDIALDEYSDLSWDWFIEKGITSDISELTPDGDDHPARLYLNFETAIGESHRMEIIWGNRELSAGEWKHLQFSENRSFPHYVANGGEENTGRWHNERVDLTELYSELWGDASGARLVEIALFCDTDGTGAQSIAYFADIRAQKKVLD
ncbi:MAG: DUF3047 domain-containing protein [Kordiimonadaceae bacterium]|jgi:hypothetical protein|nr:DUF3047 domain-containing protein [Kordiimonadaceae bacterium]MBT6037202.1 DUF3047 domain-containing protein [Kordiimonadaceae bacterium]MBT6328451.1 DUF3047 domain-containing protein [Kordiimonadaceae bacterium]MBT7583267.1 DUF3047 domain-containing protein [Kordiimonadaceae bacterium]